WCDINQAKSRNCSRRLHACAALPLQMVSMKPNPFVRDGKPLVSVLQQAGALKESVNAAVEAIGGLAQMAPRGATILLKPNFNTADPPPASSDPAFVRAVIELLYDHGAARVIVGESSSTSTRQVLRDTGMLETARQSDADVIVFDEGKWIETEVGGRYLKKVALAEAALRAEKIIYLPCLKTHTWARFTLSLKLPVGFVRRRDRWGMHLRGLQEKVADLNTVIHPDLIIMDGRRCFISGGPSKGVVREPGLILASGDRVSIDAEAVRIIKGYPENSLKKDAWGYAQIKHAVQLGLGQPGWDAHKLVDARNVYPGAVTGEYVPPKEV
ncbi:MAG: DUF362 domain-containing protein, partial [Dehalococcoidia bacterium]|nr:DUF362 domain-containing protein [Dehalococcoidia bacterium]